MSHGKILKEIKRYVTDHYREHSEARLCYHTLDHTRSVVNSVGEIADYYSLDEEDKFLLEAAAWFHDTGYLSGFADHEEKSIAIARAFLKEHGVAETQATLIEQLIRATKVPQQPSNQLEAIICDADLFHLGTVEWKERNKLLKKEVEACNGTAISKREWRKKDLIFMEAHQFHTSYSLNLLSDQKTKNIEALKMALAKEERPEESAETAKDKNERPARGIETMFKITSGNNQRLSDMADNKAHILITVNSIILSAIISLLLRKLDENPFLIVPTFILLSICLGAMIFSILATRPTVPRGRFTAEEMENKTANLLFFGNFYKMKISDYSEGMFRVMEDHQFLYGMLTRDIFTQGVVLGKKYRLLRLAYNTFMFGLVAAVIAFFIASLFHTQAPPPIIPSTH